MADLKKQAGGKKKARDEFQEDEIFQAPVIAREPSSRQARLGSKVVLRIQATGKPIPSYQWFHNGKKVVGATMDRITLSKVRRGAAGAYHCEAKNFVGKATSRVAMLSFFTQKIPKLVIGPELSKIAEGKPFTLKVTSPSAEELKEFKVYWTFNGARIKGAQGLELSISGVKKKYEGEYKAMISTGGTLEISNVAKLVLKKAKIKAAVAVADEPEEIIEEILAREPAQETEAPKANAPSWEEFTFNPEDDEEPSLVAPAPGSESFGNTSPGTPGAKKPPISQLATQDLIREVAAQGGASELMGRVSEISEDPSSLIEAADLNDLPADQREVDISSLISGPTKEELPEEKPAEESDDDLIQDWGIAPSKRPIAEEVVVVSASAVPIPIRAAPKAGPDKRLVRKKEFLEKLLGRFQGQAVRKVARAA